MLKKKDIKNIIVMSLTSFVLLMTPNIGSTATVFIGGVDDNFVGGTDPASPSAALTARINDGFGTTTDFDGLSHNQNVAHTFSNLPSQIVAGILELRVRGGTHPGVDTDGLIISFVD